jgi:predicted aldo/keto reductase-like oxidoreductase
MEFFPMAFTIEYAQTIFSNTKVADAVPVTVESFNQLSSEDQLALLWFAYSEMGVTIMVPILKGYKLSASASDVLQAIRKHERKQQFNVLQDLVANMGYSSANGMPKVKEPFFLCSY